ncbi:MAG: deoxyuridine 5'-triphosphate nucleotidohydrolase [Lachnospiraceae bacterium]|nr:deoxyuridine 5'-triphosphate nucleotidohydrolase [Lachnospiraceae bacterium]
MEKIAKFEKVSFEQFKKDSEHIVLTSSNIITEEDLKKTYEHIKLPERKTLGSAGYDFCTPFGFNFEPSKNHNSLLIPTGIRCKISEGYVLLLYVRSSLGIKQKVTLSNGTGVIDSDYYFADNEGHILISLSFNQVTHIKPFDRIVQGVFVPFGITTDDDVTTKRTGGIGSTGKE